MRKISLFAGLIAGVSALAIASASLGATVVITGGSAVDVQAVTSTVNQAATGAANTNGGQVSGHSDVTANAVSGANLSDLTLDVTGAAASASASGSTSTTMSAAATNNGTDNTNYAGGFLAALVVGSDDATSGASSATGFLGSTSSNYATHNQDFLAALVAGGEMASTSSTWQQSGSFNYATNASFNTTLPSLQTTSGALTVAQSATAPIVQTANASASSGQVVDYSTLGATGANLVNQSAGAVTVKAQ